MNKYNPKEKTDFTDPIVRCDSCNAIIKRQVIHNIGCCNKCGNRRIKNVLVLSDEEMELCRKWNIDPEFLALFEHVDEEAVANG